MCKSKFTEFSSTQVACTLKCALEYNRAKSEKKAEKELKADTKRRREAIKTKSDWIKEAQVDFNKFIRLRDANEPCIDCGQYGSSKDHFTGGKWDAGHFLSRGAYPELRFEELNCHKQLKSCNGGSGKYAKKNRTVSEGYRERLIQKIGLDKVEWLEGPHEAKRYTIDELKEIKATYRAKWRELEKRMEL